MILNKMDFEIYEWEYVEWLNMNWYNCGYSKEVDKFDINKLTNAAIDKYKNLLSEEQIYYALYRLEFELLCKKHIDIDGSLKIN